MLGNEAFTYAPDIALVVSLDSTRLWKSHDGLRKAKPFLGMHMDLDVKQIPSLRTSGRSNGRRSLIAVFPQQNDARITRSGTPLAQAPRKSRKTVLCSHPYCSGRSFTACGRGEQGEQLERMAQSVQCQRQRDNAAAEIHCVGT